MEAELRAVLTLREQEFGTKDLDVLLSCHNLAVCLARQNKMEEARPFSRRATEGAQKLLPQGNYHRTKHEQYYQQLAAMK